MKIGSLAVLARKNLRRLETIAIIVAIVGSAMTLALGGSVKSDTIRIVDASSAVSSVYGELNFGSVGYKDNYSGWVPSQNAQVRTANGSLSVSGAFQSTPTWTAVSLFKTTIINITNCPILNINVNLTTGTRYGLRFYAQYPNGTEYDVWWEGSPLDHRPGVGYESLRVNMQRESYLATGHRVDIINKMELYVEDPPYSPQSFQFTLSKLSLEDDFLEPVSNNQYQAIYLDLKEAPRENASWTLNKIIYGVTLQATQGSTFSVYYFDGPALFTSTTAMEQSYNSLIPMSQITFYPNIQPLVFPELLPQSNVSIAFVATSGTLEGVTLQYAKFEFLPITISPDLTQSQVGLYYVYFIFFLFLLPVGIALLVFREFLPRKLVPKASIFSVFIVGVICRIALAAATAHVFDMNVYLTSIRGWFQYKTTLGSVGPTLPFTFFLYWTFYSPYALLQLAGFHDPRILGHAAGVVEGVFVKLFPMAMDATTFFLLLRFRKSGASFVWATFYFLNPLSIFVSSVWGQYEAATATFIVWGIYFMSREKQSLAALAFIASGTIELIGFFPYVLLLVKTFRNRLYKSLPVAILLFLPVLLYTPEATQILRLSLAFAGFNVANSGLSQPGPFSLLGNFPQGSLVSQLKPLLISQTAILGVAVYETHRKRMNTEKMVLYIALSCVCFFLFSNLIAFWFWLLPISILYAIIKEKKDLGGFMLVFGASITFLEASYVFSSNYLIFGEFGPILPVEGITNALKITSTMATSLTMILLFLLRFGKGRAKETMLRTSGIAFSLFLLLYFWFGVYPV